MEREWTAEELEKEIKKMIEHPEWYPVCACKPQSCSDVLHMEMQHFTEPQLIRCKWCGSDDIMKYGIRNGVQNYICRKCKRKFTAKDTPYHMQTPTEQIGASLNMFYDGLSLSAIARHLEETYKNPINPSTVYRWVLRYTSEAIRILDPVSYTHLTLPTNREV